MNKLKPKYSLFTAICLVVGIVVGTGVFFKAGAVLGEVNGNLWLSTLAWVIGGIIMVVSCYNFSTISLYKENTNSLMDFAKVTCGKTFSYYVGVFGKWIYFPAMTATVSFVSAMYTCELFDIKGTTFPFSTEVFSFAVMFLVIFALLNILAPIIAGKFQISTTIIKLVPLALMAIVGIGAGLYNGTLTNNFQSTEVIKQGSGFFAAVCVTAFSYEGWICSTNVGAEIKNKEKNLPRALTIGTLIVIVIYITYNLGISGAVSNSELVNGNASEVVKSAFARLFGNAMGIILMVVVCISAFGTLNGLTMANSRNSYILATNNMGLFQHSLSKLNKRTNIPVLSSLLGVLIACCWLVYYFYSQTHELANGVGFPFSSDELPIITTYGIYIPILICLMIKGSELNKFKRFVMPTLGIVAAIFMIIAAIYRHKLYTVYYLAFVAIVMLIAFLVDKLIVSRNRDILSN